MLRVEVLRSTWILPLLIQSLLILSSVSSWRTLALFNKQRASAPIITFPNNHDPYLIHGHFMKLALDQAREAEAVGEVPIGAVLVQEIIVPSNQQLSKQSQQQHSSTKMTTGSIDCNTTTTAASYRILASAGNRVETRSDASAHAELQVLQSGAHKLRNWRLPPHTTLYSTLEPCPMCLAACQAFRLSTLVYGAPDLRLGAVTTHMQLLQYPHPYHNLSNVVAGIQQEESAALLQGFFRKRRRQQKQEREQKDFIAAVKAESQPFWSSLWNKRNK